MPPRREKKGETKRQERLNRFRRIVWSNYRRAGRSFPWRETRDPYAVLVSEVMLQQTQTERVVPKYHEFLQTFPTLAALATAPTTELLRVWRGLGYNRRALALRRCATELVERFGGTIPADPAELETLPGIGPYTARAVALFAHNHSSAFIETNIRAVFIHHFFRRVRTVRDGDIEPWVQAALPRRRVREWYYALMDYGVALKRRHPELTQRSAHYVRQSRFEGSRRQVRGLVLRLVTEKRSVSRAMIERALPVPTPHLEAVLAGLVLEGFIVERGSRYRCAE